MNEKKFKEMNESERFISTVHANYSLDVLMQKIIFCKNSKRVLKMGIAVTESALEKLNIIKEIKKYEDMAKKFEKGFDEFEYLKGVGEYLRK